MHGNCPCILPSPSTPGETSVQLNSGNGSPAYDATSLHIFIHETFPGAVLLEDHQVCTTEYKKNSQCSHQDTLPVTIPSLFRNITKFSSFSKGNLAFMAWAHERIQSLWKTPNENIETSFNISNQLFFKFKSDTGSCNIPASNCWHLLVVHLQTDWEQQRAPEHCGLLY